MNHDEEKERMDFLYYLWKLFFSVASTKQRQEARENEKYLIISGLYSRNIHRDQSLLADPIPTRNNNEDTLMMQSYSNRFYALHQASADNKKEVKDIIRRELVKKMRM